MGRNRPYSLDFMLKIKKTNPDWEFEGLDKKIYDDFINSQKNDNLIEEIEKIKPVKKKKSKVKKVKQVAERKNTESLDYFIENEIDEETEPKL